MSKSRYIYIIVIMALLYACKPQIPDRYLQPGELEDILYDYHLADAMAETGNGGHDAQYNKQLYRQAALKKHGITQAELDSSLVYYTRHSDRLHSVYENLAKRFGDEALALGASANDINRYGNITSDGDTANVWTGEKHVILMAEAPYNVMTFDFTADTTYHKGDRIILNFNSDFIFKDGIRDAIAMLAVQFSNDSVACNAMHISSNSKYNVTVSDNDRIGIKAVRGFFYLPKGNNYSATSLRLLSITNISVVRFHTKDKPVKAVADSVAHTKSDSMRRVGAPPRPMVKPDGTITTPDGRVITPPNRGVPPHPGEPVKQSMPKRMTR